MNRLRRRLQDRHRLALKGATFGLYSPDKADALPEADVKNYGGYILPKSGGIGTAIFTVVGLLLAGSSALAIVYRGRYRRDN